MAQSLITGGTALPRAGTVERFVRACGEQPGPWPAVRALLGGAEEITSPLRFTDRRLADLAEIIEADPRLRAALRSAAVPAGRLPRTTRPPRTWSAVSAHGLLGGGDRP
ncbi:hypothetical protein ACWEU6_10090 [Streptosporangium sandarakinum]|uniref:hypothetical protein n=1 Tax=Streptosporangium sandarakinum TaxID=1260955 RepID=UPI003688BC95